MWISKNERWDSYVLANISKDSLTLKHLSSFNYQLSDKPQLFISEEGNMFSNDSFRIEVLHEDSLEMITYRNDSLIEIEKFQQLNKYNPEISIIDFKNDLHANSVKYEMKDYRVHIDIVDSIRTYNYNIEKTPIGFDYFDVFEFGGEIFFILDTGYPLPIQITSINKNGKQILTTTELFKEKGSIAVEPIVNTTEQIEGVWKLNKSKRNDNPQIASIDISNDSYNVVFEDKGKFNFRISKLSKLDLYVLKTEDFKPILIEIKKEEENDIRITILGSRKELVMNLTKE
jgi:hypothetical protein